MASVSSLDQDMKKLRMSRYTPSAANEAKTWIEETLGERLPGGDLLEALKDGTVLCRLANLALPPPGVKFKKSNMPFMQMENISHFLKACEMTPLNLPAHDRFLTVDLYEGKDPAQVMQCLGAFSRVANSVNPSRFSTTIGPKRGGAMTPTHTGNTNGGVGFGVGGRGRGTSTVSNSAAMPAARALSPTVTGGSNSSRATDGGPKSPGPTSSWSKKIDEGVTAPAWNIHQYGYMGGANQGSQGISFGARRQITSAGPHVPSLADKERKRREKEAEEERSRQEAEEADRQRRAERDAQEEKVRIEEERRWEEETRRQREEEKRRVEQQKREWDEQERRWKAAEEARLREEREEQERLDRERSRKRTGSDARLKGQFLSQYQAEQKVRSRQVSYNDPELQAERERVRELESQLEEAKERERRYQQEREERSQTRQPRSRSRSGPRPPPKEPSPDSNVSWNTDEREYLRQQWNEQQERQIRPRGPSQPQRPLPDPKAAAAAEPPPPSFSSRPLPNPTASPVPAPLAQKPPTTSPRPLPDPAEYRGPPPPTRTERFLATNPAPAPARPTSHFPPEMGLTSTSERRAEDDRRAAAQTKTKAGGWASKSLLEREMERERERQREWEEAQKQAAAAPRDTTEGSRPGQSWNVNQYGFVGGDGQNRGATGIGFGGRRQIIGPRPQGPR